MGADRSVVTISAEAAPGYILYTADGMVMVLWTGPHGVPPRELEDLTIAERARIAATTVAYCGRYEVERGVLRHHVEVGLFPVWSGRTRVRFALLKGRRLIFTSPPDRAGTVTRTYWERVGRRRT
jgi:hypothetical protein